MSYNVILLPAAEDDYQEILRYFERQFDSQQAIRSFVKDFGEVLLRLEETPTFMGTPATRCFGRENTGSS